MCQALNYTVSQGRTLGVAGADSCHPQLYLTVLLLTPEFFKFLIYKIG